MTMASVQGRARRRQRYSVNKPWADVYASSVLAAAQAQAASPLLDDLGRDGWELVSVSDAVPGATGSGRDATGATTTFYFKRRDAGSVPRWREDEWWWWRW